MALLPTSPLAWSGRTPDALPYGVDSACLPYCLPTPSCQVRWFPTCLCTYEATMPLPFAADAPAAHAQAPAHAPAGRPAE